MSVNINIGVLGHVDSGKTSLCRVLSTVTSTCSLDKHPESRKRGITLDLGFSAFSLSGEAAPRAIHAAGYNRVQFTLVDCPGHASLIKTIIGGASIIDMMLLVLDITKGIQTQTAECLVLADILPNTSQLIIVLNKLDCVPTGRQETRINRLRERIANVLSGTRFAGSPIVATAASIGGRKSVGEAVAAAAGKDGIEIGRALAKAKISQALSGNVTGPGEEKTHGSLGVTNLIAVISEHVQVPLRNGTGPLYFSVDHCFPVRGQGTVLTGTILSGSVSVNDEVELPELQLLRKVKSIQMFRKPISRAMQGDRIGLCVKNLDAKLVERGIVASPGSLTRASAVLAIVKKVKYYGEPVPTKGKFHISIGHATTMCTALFFGSEQIANDLLLHAGDAGAAVARGGIGSSTNAPMAAHKDTAVRSFDYDREYLHDEYLHSKVCQAVESVASDQTNKKTAGSCNCSEDQDRHRCEQWALLIFRSPIICRRRGSVIIGSRLDSEKSNACRLAFHGTLVEPFDMTCMSKLKIFRRKSRVAIVDKVEGCGNRNKNRDAPSAAGTNGASKVIAKGLFGKQSDLSKYIGKHVTTLNGDTGTIESAFGKSGKFKVVFDPPVSIHVRDKLYLNFRSYIRL